MHISTVKDLIATLNRAEGIITIEKDATISIAAYKLKQNSIGCVLVVDRQNKTVGLISERDMINKIIAENKPAEQILVKDAMTTNPICCSLDMPLSEVEEIMTKHKIRHVPIIENDRPAGMLSSRDIMSYRLETNRELKTAAEEIARIAMSLKSLDFDDLIELAIHVSPTLFNADKAALYLNNKSSGTSRIHRNCCMMSENELTAVITSPEIRGRRQKPIISKQTCKCCTSDCNDSTHLLIPLFFDDQTNENKKNDETLDGLLCICDFKKPAAMSEEVVHYKADLLQELLVVNLTNAKLFQDYQRARHDSETDPLTGAKTRRIFDSISEAEFTRALRYNHPFCIGIMDLDNFKKINDSNGHSAGDFVLQFLAKTIDKMIRKTDVFSRYGGDEFVLLMPETNLYEAKNILDRIRTEVSYIQTPGGLKVTISCGLATWLSKDTDKIKDIFKRADSALYEAKRLGRNRVVTTEELTNAAVC